MLVTRVRPHVHRSIWYMGAKSRVLPDFLDEVLTRELEPGDTFVDLMSGSGVVSAYCAGRYRVFSNDVQAYSQAIARSLIEHDPGLDSALLGSLDPVTDLATVFSANRDALTEAFAPALREEDGFLAEFRETGGTGSWPTRYRNFLERAYRLAPGCRVPANSRLYGGARHLYAEAALDERRQRPRTGPAYLVTTYYQNVYYGLRQAIELDSLRIAIEHMNSAEPLRRRRQAHYLSALIHAASVTTSGTSHFAQPRHLTKDSELRAMAKRRTADVFEVFEGYCEEIADTLRHTDHVAGNRALLGDYRERIDARGRFRFPAAVDLVYLDPPYTADNYSRFYHVLEVLTRYEYPVLERDRRGEILRGRYPLLANRFQSDFCRPSQVENEFRRVLDATARSGAKLVISYSSPTGLLLKTWARKHPDSDPLLRFRHLALEYFGAVEILQRPLMHSGQGDSNIPIDELLVVCTEPRPPSHSRKRAE